MLTQDDIKAIKDIVNGAVGPLATKTGLASLDTKLTRFEVNMTRQFTDLKNKTTKDTDRLERAIKTRRKVNNEDFGHLEKEDRKIVIRVEKIERHIGFAPAS